jgi:hypothetical protein
VSVIVPTLKPLGVIRDVFQRFAGRSFVCAANAD